MSTQSEIKRRREHEDDNAKLAAAYAKGGHYEEAAIWYRAAGFHKAVREELETIAREYEP